MNKKQVIITATFIFLSYGFQLMAQNVGIGTLTPSSKLQVGDFFANPDSVYVTIGSAGGNTSMSGIKLHHYNNAYGFTIESDDRTTSQGLNIRRHANSSLGQSAMFIDISGNVGISTTSPDASAALDVTSTTKGFLPPRMTKVQRDAIASPAEGLMISCTDCTVLGLHQYINGAWQAMTSSNTGNYGTVVNPATGKVWLDRNLGATQVATSSTDEASYGDLFQWGRAADGHQLRASATQGTQATSWLADEGSNVWDGKFIIGFSNWLTTAATDLWSGTAAENNPCPSGYRVPTNAEWNQERRTWTTNNAAGAFASPLKLPVAGSRNGGDGSLSNVGTGGLYWSSTVSSTDSRYLSFSSSSAGMSASSRALGPCVRCLKD